LREIARAAAGHAGIEVEFVAVPFEQVQRTLEDGRAEAVFPLTITPERLPLFDFSDPFLVTGGALFVKDLARSQIRSWPRHEPVLSQLIFKRMHRRLS
jgi:ABC-type amino acid transport substrate-binding protein